MNNASKPSRAGKQIPRFIGDLHSGISRRIGNMRSINLGNKTIHKHQIFVPMEAIREIIEEAFGKTELYGHFGANRNIYHPDHLERLIDPYANDNKD